MMHVAPLKPSKQIKRPPLSSGLLARELAHRNKISSQQGKKVHKIAIRSASVILSMLTKSIHRKESM